MLNQKNSNTMMGLMIKNEKEKKFQKFVGLFFFSFFLGGQKTRKSL
jgi:hypothetical protein